MNSSETTILDGSSGLMTVRHLFIEGTNMEIGQKLAEVVSRRHGLGPGAFSSPPEQTSQIRDYVSRHYPVMLERQKGVARALGVDFAGENHDFTGLPYNMGMPGCSSVFYPASTAQSGHPVLSRNYDFCIVSVPEMLEQSVSQPKPTPAMAEPYLLELHPSDGGYPSLAMISFDLLSGVLDGINSQGLCAAAHGNEVMIAGQGLHRPQSRTGIHELQALRLVLDTCADVGQAKQTLLSNRIYYELVPLIYLVADRHGRWMVFAPSFDNGTPSIIEGSDITTLTNHFPLVQSEKRDMMEVGTSSFQRWDRLQTQLSGNTAPYSIEDMKAINHAVSASQVISWVPAQYRTQIAAQPGMARTLWHALYDLQDLSLNIKFYVGEKPAGEGGFEEEYSDYCKFALE